MTYIEVPPLAPVRINITDEHVMMSNAKSLKLIIFPGQTKQIMLEHCHNSIDHDLLFYYKK